ncbi:MAG: AAA family ATPase [Thermodesulfobacteriota bacterium]|nr:AAA family ATPase [Thermodesulfobacteriota bacterium]
MPESAISVRLDIKNQKVREDLNGIISAIEGFSLQKSDASLSCDLLILEIGDGDLTKEFQVIHSIQTSGNVREIFLTSSRLEPELLIQALRAGAKEFFPQPIKKEEVMEALLKFKAQGESLKLSSVKKKRGKIINIIGSKGGVGTTTIAVNLATSLIETKGSPSVALIDMNLLFGEIPIFLNVESAFNWGEIARNISRLDSTYLMSILSKHHSGVYVLPSPTGLDGVNVATPEIIGRLLSLMRNVFDFIVIDGGQSLDDISLKILEMSDTVLLVAILSLPCLSNLKRLLWTFQRLGYPEKEKIKIIISRYHKKSLISLKDAEESIKQKISWLVPNDYLTTMSAINQGKILSSVANGVEITKNLRELALTFLEKGEKGKNRLLFETFR